MRSPSLRGVAGVEQQVHEHLLQLIGIGGQQRQIVLERDLELQMPAPRSFHCSSARARSTTASSAPRWRSIAWRREKSSTWRMVEAMLSMCLMMMRRSSARGPPSDGAQHLLGAARG